VDYKGDIKSIMLSAQVAMLVPLF